MEKSLVLKALMYPDANTSHQLSDADAMAAWLQENSLGGLAAKQLAKSYPALSEALQAERYFMLAENSVHLKLLKQILAALDSAEIPLVLLKGIALLEGTYKDLAARSMTDIDLWIEPAQITPALAEITQSDFYQAREKDYRPVELQLLADGEIQIQSHEHPRNLVELHLSPFAGWWLKRTAAIDNKGLWQRKTALLVDGVEAFELSAEDSILHLAIHNVINHQFGQQAVRALVDTVAIAQARNPDWQTLAARARNWRIASAVWLHLYFAEQLIGLPSSTAAIQQLAPAPWKQKLLTRILSADAILNGKDIRSGLQRYLFLLLLVDRLQDRINLAIRTLWPEPQWLTARYSKTDTGNRNLRLLHLQQMLGRGKL